MELEQCLFAIQRDFLNKLGKVESDVMETAVAFLREDIQDPSLSDPDAFMLRANEIGRALFNHRFFAVAERMYRVLVQKTLDYRQEIGNWKHAGALYANIAGACAVQGKLDQAVVQLLKAAKDDVKTYEEVEERSDSYAITGLLHDYFVNPVRKEALKTVQRVNPTLTLADMEAMGDLLGIREYAFLAYVHLALVSRADNQEFPNEFSQLQIFSALRSLSCLLEVVLLEKVLGDLSRPRKRLFRIIQELYKCKAWWSDFDDARINTVKAIEKSEYLDDDQLGAAVAIPAPDDDSRFWRSLLIAYVVRNYTVHQLETQCALVQDYSDEALGHILHVMITAPRHR